MKWSGLAHADRLPLRRPPRPRGRPVQAAVVRVPPPWSPSSAVDILGADAHRRRRAGRRRPASRPTTPVHRTTRRRGSARSSPPGPAPSTPAPARSSATSSARWSSACRRSHDPRGQEPRGRPSSSAAEPVRRCQHPTRPGGRGCQRWPARWWRPGRGCGLRRCARPGRSCPPGWWRRRPFLPVPDRALGPVPDDHRLRRPGADVDVEDLLTWLAWTDTVKADAPTHPEHPTGHDRPGTGAERLLRAPLGGLGPACHRADARREGRPGVARRDPVPLRAPRGRGALGRPAAPLRQGALRPAGRPEPAGRVRAATAAAASTAATRPTRSTTSSPGPRAGRTRGRTWSPPAGPATCASATASCTRRACRCAPPPGRRRGTPGSWCRSARSPTTGTRTSPSSRPCPRDGLDRRAPPGDRPRSAPRPRGARRRHAPGLGARRHRPRGRARVHPATTTSSTPRRPRRRPGSRSSAGAAGEGPCGWLRATPLDRRDRAPGPRPLERRRRPGVPPVGTGLAAGARRLGVVGTRLHEGALACGPLGGTVCFAGRGPGEVLVGDAKVVGISQRRTRAGARFQCAVPVRWDPAPLAALLSSTRTSPRSPASAPASAHASARRAASAPSRRRPGLRAAAREDRLPGPSNPPGCSRRQRRAR